MKKTTHLCKMSVNREIYKNAKFVYPDDWKPVFHRPDPLRAIV